MSSNYFTIHKNKVEQNSTEEPLADMVSMVDISPNGRNYISYLRMVNRVPTIMKYWDTASCVSTFIKNRILIDPETTLPINPGFIQRIMLYNQTLEKFGVDFEPAPGQIKTLFNNFLEQTITPDEKLMLRSFLFLEDTSVLHDFSVEKSPKIVYKTHEEWVIHNNIKTTEASEIRAKALDVLNKAKPGSWLLRKSSIRDSIICKTKVLSFIIIHNQISHIPFVHVKGYGYFIPDVGQGFIMPDLPLSDEEKKLLDENYTLDDDIVDPRFNPNNPLPFPQNNMLFTCLLDLLEHLIISNHLLFKNYISALH